MTGELPGYKQARRDRIIAAAMAALAEQDYEHIQMREVAERADVALGTLYRYFSSKEHVYAAVLTEWAQPVLAAPGSAVPRRAGDAETRVREKVRGIIASFERRPAFFKVCMLLQNSADHNAAQLMAAFADIAQETLAADFADLGSVEAADTAVMLWGIVNTMLSAVLLRGYPMADAYRVADAFIDLVAPRMG